LQRANVPHPDNVGLILNLRSRLNREYVISGQRIQRNVATDPVRTQHDLSMKNDVNVRGSVWHRVCEQSSSEWHCLFLQFWANSDLGMKPLRYMKSTNVFVSQNFE
jgi:hypothetical protein